MILVSSSYRLIDKKGYDRLRLLGIVIEISLLPLFRDSDNESALLNTVIKAMLS